MLAKKGYPMDFTPQQNRVYSYLKENKKIDPLTALSQLGVYRLSDVIFKLRTEHNIEIETKMTKSLNKYQETVKYATYVLKDK